MKKLIIFDCDGVLVDSELIAHKVGLKALNKLGCQMTLEESIRRFTGLNNKSESQILYNEFGLTLSKEFYIDRQHATLEAFESELKPLMELILNFLEKKAISRCVASSSPRERVLRSLVITEQNHFFEDSHIFTSSQVEKGKPAPDLFLFAAEKMGILPENCLVIEDSVAGIQAARSAQMSVIGFLGGNHTKFHWYQENIKNQNIPVAFHYYDLVTFIDNFIEK
ncbi:MAG TPA: HAD family hydrolase [Gammaproteobacteria bacterium]|nr:HAD family hydrolase [Gammaproteobacteria bacterium]